MGFQSQNFILAENSAALPRSKGHQDWGVSQVPMSCCDSGLAGGTLSRGDTGAAGAQVAIAAGLVEGG